MSGPDYPLTQRHILEERNSQPYQCEKLKTRKQDYDIIQLVVVVVVVVLCVCVTIATF
jgi:hypothetical protein